MRSFWKSFITLCIALGASTIAQAGPRDAQLTGVININTATETELQMLPGIGAKKAELIVAVRATRKYENPEQIRRVKGIGRNTYRRLKPYLAVNGNTTLAVATGTTAPPPTETKDTSPINAAPKPATPAGKPPPAKAPAKTPVAPKAPVRA